jgi:hypothetical protein
MKAVEEAFGKRQVRWHGSVSSVRTRHEAHVSRPFQNGLMSGRCTYPEPTRKPTQRNGMGSVEEQR